MQTTLFSANRVFWFHAFAESPKEAPIKFPNTRHIPSGAKEATEKGLMSVRLAQRASAGAKARLILLALSARLKSCPVTKPQEAEFSAVRKTRVHSEGFI